MNISESFEEILKYSHWRNWAPDLYMAQEIYKAFPESYAVLTPFAYSYLEELIRSTTSEYGIIIYDEKGSPKKRKVGLGLIQLAIKENEPNSKEFVSILEEIKSYFLPSQSTDEGDNRNSVDHGYMHPRFWNKESFEKLINDIAKLSKYARF